MKNFVIFSYFANTEKFELYYKLILMQFIAFTRNMNNNNNNNNKNKNNTLKFCFLL